MDSEPERKKKLIVVGDRVLIAPEEGQLLLAVIGAKAEMLPALSPIPPFTRDPKDDKFVACAVAGQVGYLITLDRDILELEQLEGVVMITPHDFIGRK